MTNKDKLVAWHKSTYDAKSDEYCWICLSQKQVYLLGQATRQMRWRTRWIGGFDQDELDYVVGDLEERLADMTACTDIAQILTEINNIKADISSLQVDFDSTQAAYTSTIDVDTDTVDTIAVTPLMDAVSGADTTCDNDAVYGAVSQIVEYINQTNVDFLEYVTQIANVSEQTKRVISAIPLLNLLPFDEMADYAAFLINELLDEYNATVTESLLQIVKCDLFCIAIGNTDCKLSFGDLLNYFGSHVSATFGNAVTTFADLVEFAITGTFASSLYFYYLCYFQLWCAYAATTFLRNVGYKEYGLQGRAGYNSPDSDWAIFCDCVTYPVLVTGDDQIACNLTTSPLGTLESLGNGNWRLTSEDNGSGEQWGTFQEEAGLLIKISSATRTAGSQPFRRYCDAAETTTSLVLGDIPLGVSMYGYRFGLTTGTTIIYEFHAEFAV